MLPKSKPPYTVSAALLAREDFQAACRARNFGAMFHLMQQWDGVSQDDIAKPVDGLVQGRISQLINGKGEIAHQRVIENIADGLHVPGEWLGLAAREWEHDAAPVPTATSTSAPSAPELRSPVEEILDRGLSVEVNIASDGAVTLTYRHHLRNGGKAPLSRVIRELWFKHTSGPLLIEPVARDEADTEARDVIIQTIRRTDLNATYACQIFPAIQPGESATITYTCSGGRFVDEYYWRQAVLFPTDEVRIKVIQHGISRLTRCTATEERADGAELSATHDVVYTRQDDAMVIEVARRDLEVNSALTLEWDFPRA